MHIELPSRASSTLGAARRRTKVSCRSADLNGHATDPWVAPDAEAEVLHPVSDEDWNQIAAAYDGPSHASRPLRAVFDVVREGDCRTVVVEHRYIDLDFRSEHAAFWAQRFEIPSPFTRRLHFFATEIAAEDLHRLSGDPTYLGYAVLRPVEAGRVGRTVLAPPPRLKDATITTIREVVSLFGNDLTVEGVPFCEQDAEYLRCAHAAAWVCHYVAVRRELVGRRSTAEIVALTPNVLSTERALPSKGLSLLQLQAVFGELGQPAIHYGFSALPDVRGVSSPEPSFDDQGRPKPPGLWDTRCISIICRYLNSGFPVLVAGDGHAWVLVGWHRDANGQVIFIACDDQVGPYEEIRDPFTHYRAPWLSIMVPLPPKVFLPAESAENDAHAQLQSIWASSSALRPLADELTSGDIQLRTYLRNVRTLKRDIAEQASSDEVLRGLRMLPLPHFVWVVEAHKQSACRASPCVVSSVLYDSTSSDHAPRLTTVAVPGAVALFPPSPGTVRALPASREPWRSLLPAH